MDRRQRMAILSEAAGLDRDSRLSVPARIGNQVGIVGVGLPSGGSTTLMRIMQTNACSLSCGYCPTFCGGKVKRATLAPEEAATTFMEAHRKGLAQGLFLTSGVPGRAVRATDRMLATLELLRRREGFRGYVHVKLLPGAETSQVEAAARWASRISVNLEAPTDAYVRILAKEKDFSGDLLPKLELAGRLLGERGDAAGTTTQFVVGAAGERDREILGVVARLERRRLLHHAHFSAFQPVAGTPMEGQPGHAGRARAQALSGRAPAPAVRLRLRGAAVRGRRQPAARGRSEDRLGRRSSRAISRWSYRPRPTRCCCGSRASDPAAARTLVVERRRSRPERARATWREPGSTWSARATSSRFAAVGWPRRFHPASSGSSLRAST